MLISFQKQVVFAFFADTSLVSLEFPLFKEYFMFLHLTTNLTRHLT